MKHAAALVLLAGCMASAIPPDARVLTDDERAIVDEHVGRWDAVIAPLTPHCVDYADRLLAIDADRDSMLRWCWRCPPSAYDQAPCESRWGRAAGCAAQRADTGLIVAYAGLSDVEHDNVIGHEATHLLGHCQRPEGHDWLGHTDPALWGAGGVHPL